MIAGARIKVPLTFIPITLQPFFVLLSGTMLGPVYGAASQLAYVFLGLLGFPVFSEGGGLAYILKPSFGYLVGFPFASFTAGVIVHRGVAAPKILPNVGITRLILANAIALLVIFIPGVLYLWLNLNFMLGKSLSLVGAVYGGFLIFLPGDVLKIIGVILLYRALQPRLAVMFRLSINAPTLKTTTTTAAETESRSGQPVCGPKSLS
jgi:biotin transport system substrate-specific component